MTDDSFLLNTRKEGNKHAVAEVLMIASTILQGLE